MAVRNEYFPDTAFHPGSTLSELLEEKHIGAKEFAVRTGKPEKTISDVLNEKSRITPEMAILFEQVLKVPAHFWINSQRSYDEFMARAEYQKVIKNSKKWAGAFPYAEMASLDWVPKTAKKEEQVANLFKYFAVSCPKGYYDFYYNQKLLANFRISLKPNKNAAAITAWLRQGEIQANTINVGEFDKKKLTAVLPKLKDLVASQPADFFTQIQDLCTYAGIKVVITECLPKTTIYGSTRWLNNIPLIQLSGHYDRNDVFWFTFFHEIGHVFLHGKKYISIENAVYDGANRVYENEANTFSDDLLLNIEQEKEITSNTKLTETDIVHYAKKFEIHPAIILGRLQRLNIIPNELGTNLTSPIDFFIVKKIA